MIEVAYVDPIIAGMPRATSGAKMIFTTIDPTPQYLKQTDTPVFQSNGFTLTMVVGIVALASSFFKIVTKFNEIDLGFKDLKEDLKNHASSEGHEKIINQLKFLEKEIYSIDSRFKIHEQNYINRQEVVNMLTTQLAGAITHSTERWKDELKDVEAEVKELQRYLQKQRSESFVIREGEK